MPNDILAFCARERINKQSKVDEIDHDLIPHQLVAEVRPRRGRATMLNAAIHARQMDAPGLRLHPLKGKPEGRWAVDVDENYRVVFRCEQGHAYEVDYDDYH